MSKQTDKSLFIVSSMSGLYQALLSGIESYKELGNRIIEAIKVAQAFRQVEKVAELSHVLVNIPIKEYQLIAQYYSIWCECQKQNYQSTALEQIIEQTQTYKAQALLTRGSFDMCQCKPESALRFYGEALKSSRNVPDFISISLATAQVKGIEGFSESALKDLENLLPLIKHADARLYNTFLNSYAYELGKAGRKGEARNIIKRVLASPLAIAYPGWHETAQELKEPGRSFISIPVSIPKIERRHVEIETKPAPTKKDRKPASILPFRKLEEAPEPEQPDRISPKELGEMTDVEKKELLMVALRTDAIRTSHYDNIIFHAGMLKSGPVSNVIDLEDNALLDRLIIHWVNMIEPEEFTGVLSALRDCDDPIRQANLIDRMIQKAFQYSQAGYLSEEQWRLKHERRLPKK